MERTVNWSIWERANTREEVCIRLTSVFTVGTYGIGETSCHEKWHDDDETTHVALNRKLWMKFGLQKGKPRYSLGCPGALYACTSASLSGWVHQEKHLATKGYKSYKYVLEHLLREVKRSQFPGRPRQPRLSCPHDKCLPFESWNSNQKDLVQYPKPALLIWWCWKRDSGKWNIRKIRKKLKLTYLDLVCLSLK